SHELRTPLTMIKTSADIVLEERPGRINETQKNFLEIIANNVLRLMNLVEDILSRIKIETTWLKLDLRPVDVRSLFKETIVGLKPIIEKKNQVLKFAYPKLLSKALADKNWIQQVLINLINNSSKNLGDQGTIVISLKENEQYILVSVSDNGVGIDPERTVGFFAGEEPENTRDFGSIGDGFGFGLSIVRHIVEMHHGKIYVGSVAGLGTTFSFTLPKKEGGSP
ncbi:MAG: sensor histidine kinase, partial [Desulfobacteraceae bacterium]